MDKISIIVPCYNEEECLPVFYEEICGWAYEMKEVEYELIFVNDGSSDESLMILKRLADANPNVKYISFTRNFGKEAAMLAGLQKATGDFVVIMDADLQHPVRLLPEMYQTVKYEGFECACAKRMGREGDGKLRSYLTKRFYRIINRISEVEMEDGAGDYRMMTRKMVDSIVSFKEYNRYSKGLFSFVGFKTKMISYENVQRTIGATKWSLISLTKYAFDGVISFSTVPLVLSSFFGIVSCLIAFVLAATTAIRTLIYGNPTDGWTTLICVILFVGGLQMFFLGIIGEYLSKIYLETKQRPIYIVQETNIAPTSK
jgi:glucosyltransferase